MIFIMDPNRFIAFCLTTFVFGGGVVSAAFPDRTIPIPGGDSRKAESFFKLAEKGFIEPMREMIAAGQKVDERNAGGQTALMKAAAAGHKEIVELLIANGADVKTRSLSETGSHVLSWSVQNGGLDVVKVLVEAGSPINVRAKNGVSPLGRAASIGDADIVRYLVEQGADIEMEGVELPSENVRRPTLISPLMVAAKENHPECLQILIDAGAELNKTGWVGDTAIAHAARSGHVATVRILLIAGADVNSRSYSGCTPLIYSGYNGFLEITELLLAAGADPHVVGRNREIPSGKFYGRFTARSEAARNGHEDVAKIIKEAMGRVERTEEARMEPKMPVLPAKLPEIGDENFWDSVDG